jgi:putative SOS response-associated peptidase YedK
MLNRYTIGVLPSLLQERFLVTVPERFKARYNAAPAQLLPVITAGGAPGISFFYWGTTPDWAANKSITPRLINAPAGELQQRTSYRNALQSRRCIVPADGFYLWKRVSKRGQVPYRIFAHDNEIFSFAGLWEEFEDTNGTMVHTFTVITVPANGLLSGYADTMPAMLNSDMEKIWLNLSSTPEQLMDVLQPWESNKMGVFAVSPRVNDPALDVPSLIKPAPPADQFGNYTLFD